ncbi:MAG: hypothetical protein ACT6FF_07895, partial [Methanosarcinaceae archaeon]
VKAGMTVLLRGCELLRYSLLDIDYSLGNSKTSGDLASLSHPESDLRLDSTPDGRRSPDVLVFFDSRYHALRGNALPGRFASSVPQDIVR